MDAHHITDSYKFISVLLLSLSAMLRLGLPHVNVLSKIDLLKSYGPLPFSLDFYTDVLDLNYLISDMNQSSSTTKFSTRFMKLTSALVDLITDFSLVQFIPLDIQDGNNLVHVLRSIDTCNGCAYASTIDLTNSASTVLQDVTRSSLIADIQERMMEEDLEGRKEDVVEGVQEDVVEGVQEDGNKQENIGLIK